MKTTCWLLIAFGMAAASALPAQEIAGSISGVVRDTSGLAIAGADVSIRPGVHRTRTDSTGRFVISGLGADKYTVVARKVGFAPTSFDVSLRKDGHVDIGLTFDRRLPVLDTVTVTGTRECSAWSLDGFACRRHAGGGVFLDYTDIDEKEPIYTADIFRDIPGFRIDLRSTRTGPMRVPVAANGWGCIASLVDGRPASPARRIPDSPYDLLAVEIYTKPDSVPREYQQYTWPDGSVAARGRCAVVVYWTLLAKLSP
ncbi:MAG TPA: carboxypeptidase-like regulatory domain-containing protein [Gemmatimonadaceae bacterium]|nr:carboxypeptidase-like regulatory domain-containing protein [Gemmatimonadaceae bacterium]